MENFLESIKNKLLKEKQKIEGELQKIAQLDQKEDWNANFPSFDSGNLEEASDEVEEYATLVSISETLEKKLKDINLALEKIERGEYGICENCGQKISQERLKIYPTARLCRKCQK
jgi:DnaK suppressor protein